jgi:hypothetical protein
VYPKPADLVLAAVNFGVFLFFFFLLLLFLRYIYKLVKVYFGLPTDAAISTPIRLISISIASLAFPNVIQGLVKILWKLVNLLFVTLPDLATQNIPSLQSACRSVQPETCVYIISNVFITILASTLRSFVPDLAFNTFPFVDALLMLSLWVLLCFSFQHICSIQSFPSFARLSPFWTSIRGIRASTRSNVMLFVILALGTYLSLTAIIAIPVLQERIDTESSNKVKDLRNNLDQLIVSDEDFSKEFPAIIAKESEITGSEIYKQLTYSAESTKSEAKVPFDLIANNQSDRLNDLRKRWVNLIAKYKTAQNDQVQIAAETFEIGNKDRRGIRERDQQFLSIDVWYRRWRSQMIDNLRACRSAIERYGSLFLSQFESVGALASKSTAIDSNLLSNLLTQKSRTLEDTVSQAYKDCTATIPDEPVPSREEFGRYLGIFGRAAEWLFKTESLPLVLITGLLGFGLLGSACASFIRNSGSRAPADALVPNLSSVVIRGASAAILVFLAVYGGLAVFAGSAATPNPYVVLFTCLAAAVFSEDAWAWVADRFRRDLNAKPRESQPGTAHGPPVTED